MFKLLFERNFGALNVTQFMTTFNDNALKQLYFLITVTEVLRQGTGGGGYEEQAYATALFSLPYIFFSGFAGRLSDWISKQTVIVWTKFAEILIVGVGAYGLYSGRDGFLLGALFGLATQSAFFSPAKYGILPEMLPKTKLSAANGLLQSTAYAAILIGTASSGLMLEYFEQGAGYIGLVLIGMAGVGWASSLLIEPRPASDPDKALIGGLPGSSLFSSLSWIVRYRALFVSILGFSYVWFAGTILLFNINVYGLDYLGLGQAYTSLLTVILALGLGGGCLLAGKLSGDRIESGLILIGSTGMGGALLLFSLGPASAVGTSTLLVAVGLFGGLFLIPLQTLMQELPGENRTGEALGVANIFTFVGVFCASVVYYYAEGVLRMSATDIMGSLGLMTIGAGLLIVSLAPRFFVRFVLFTLIFPLCKVRSDGHETVPEKGPALMVARGGSSVDPILIEYVIDRPVRFMMSRNHGDGSFVSSLLNMMDVILVDPNDPDSVRDGLEAARAALQDGEPVCLFPDRPFGDGHLPDRVQEAMENLASKTNAMIPVAVEGADESAFGRTVEGMGDRISRMRAPVRVRFGYPVDAPASIDRIRAVMESESRREV